MHRYNTYTYTDTCVYIYIYIHLFIYLSIVYLLISVQYVDLPISCLTMALVHLFRPQDAESHRYIGDLSSENCGFLVAKTHHCPSGKLTTSHGKSQVLMGQSTNYTWQFLK